MTSISTWLSLGSTVFALTAHADDSFQYRWTGAEDTQSDLAHVLQIVNTRSGFGLKASDFVTFEDRDLAKTHFKTLVQVSNGLPISGMSIRLWTDLATGNTVQAEVELQDPTTVNKARYAGLSSAETMTAVRKEVLRSGDDHQIRDLKWRDQLQDNRPVRVVTVKGRRGKRTIVLSLKNGRVLSSTYNEFPKADEPGEFSLPAMVFPIYEEVEGTGRIQSRVPRDLRYLKSTVSVVGDDPYAVMKAHQYTEEFYDPVQGMTDIGRAMGYWSMTYLKSQAAGILSQLPTRPNAVDAGGVILDGRYATISLHPEAKAAFAGLNFVPGNSGHFMAHWQPIGAEDGPWQMLPMSGLQGKPLMVSGESLSRPARRLPNHDPASYINDGFDEIQVYYAINQLFDSLKPMGFTDPELSTRPFNAFMYDPDISMRDNAYYTDDTINFTTYSPESANAARDNSTIWHELGHGVMDRLMGDLITLADTGGLSEGMADFVAALVIADVSNNQPFDGSNEFRIINHTGFHLTNEVHDDGESYGGAMKDLLDGAMAKFGNRDGLRKVADLTMETMRFTRNHPALDANGWFEHMVFADSLGADGVRAKGELKDLIIVALAGRNYSLDGGVIAEFSLKNGTDEVASGKPGSRNSPLHAVFAGASTSTYHLSVKLTDGDAYKFKFPVTVKVEYHAGALQGAVHWMGEEQGAQTYVLKSAADVLNFDVTASSQCDEVNRPDGSCVDYAYVQILNNGETSQPQAKKRFYLSVLPQ